MAKSNYEKNMESLPKDEVNDLSLDEQGDSINGIKEQFGCLADNLNRKPNYFQMKEKENLRLERLIKVLTELYLLQSGKAELYMDEVNLTFLLREV